MPGPFFMPSPDLRVHIRQKVCDFLRNLGRDWQLCTLGPYRGGMTLSIPDLLGPDAPGVRMIEVTTLSGSASVKGTSQALGNATDAALFAAMRDWADAIVVGTKTAQAEDYGGSATPLYVLSYSFSLDPHSRLFTEGTPILAVPHAQLADAALSARRAAYEAAGARFLDTGDGSMASVVAALRAQGHERIVCEGGPGIYSGFIAEDLVDALYLTVHPLLSSSVDTPLVFPKPAAKAGFHRDMRLDNVAADTDGTVFLRYTRARSR